MNGVNKAVKIISKIGEVAAWIGTGFSAVGTVIAATGNLEALKYVSDVNKTTEANIGDFSVNFYDKAGDPIVGTYVAFFAMAVIVLVFTALICRNINKIFKKMETETPFQAEIVGRIRKVAYFFIAVPVVEFVFSFITAVMVNGADISAEINMNGIFVGLVVLAIAQVFSYGIELQDEVEGLV